MLACMNIDDPAYAQVQTQEGGEKVVSLVFPTVHNAGLERRTLTLSGEQARALAQRLLDAALLVEQSKRPTAG
jgi:hypothetical protein